MIRKPSQPHINTYNKGINKDLSANLYPNDSYLDAELMTPMINEENNIGKMVNIKGNNKKFQIPSNAIIIGQGSIRDYIIIVTADTSGNTTIYKVQDDGSLDIQSLTTVYTDSALSTIYKLKYTVNTEVNIVTRYESSTVQKVYMAAEGFPLRYFNLEDPNLNNTKHEDYFNIIPSVILTKPTFNNYTSGNKKSGKVCYSYQLYRIYGNETSFSQCSELISISSSIKAGSVSQLYGSEADVNTGVGVEIVINNLDTDFDRIRVLSFDYTDLNSNPSINIIYEGSYASSSMTIVDDGSSLGNYDLSMFRTLHSFIPKPKDIAQKNNILFPINLEEEYFDIDNYLNNSSLTYNQGILTTDAGGSGKKFWDSRIYRFNSTYSRLYDSTGTSIQQILYASSPNYDAIPYNYACVNISNLVENNDTYYENSEEYKYKSSGSLGGSGKNMEMEYGVSLDNLDTTSSLHLRDGSIVEGFHDGNKPHFQSDEIYRYSIQFENYLGQKSYPKWIMDSRTPNLTMDDGSGVFQELIQTHSSYSYITQVKRIFPKFKIRNCPKNPDGSFMKWRILRVQRDGLNKTIIGTGLISATLGGWETGLDAIGNQEPISAFYYKNNIYLNPKETMSWSDINKTTLQLISPELTMSDIDISNFELHHMGYYNLRDEDEFEYRYTGGYPWKNFADEPADLHSGKFQVVRKLTNLKYASYTNQTGRIKTIDSWAKVIPNKDNVEETSANYTIGGVSYRHIHQTLDSAYAFGTTMRIVNIPSAFDTFSNLNSASKSAYMFVTIKNTGVPYGGNSYEAKLRNIYVPASDFANGSSTLSTWNECNKGDTYYSYFEFLRSQAHAERSDDVFQEVLYIPVESQYNFNLRVNKDFNSIADGNFDASFRLREDGLVDSETGVELPKLYQYNAVYSKDDNTEQYIPIQDDALDNYLYDHRIRRSEIKFNNEYSDSWLKFLPNNYLDVDGQYGELTAIKVFKDKLIYFQEHGFGTVPVEEKELIPSSDSSTLSLGSSGILNRYDYLSNTVGCTQKGSIVITPNNLYIYDNINKTIHSLKGDVQSLSDVEGVNSWLDSNVDIDSTIESAYNPVLKEILYKFDDNLLVFNELNNSFVYRYPSSMLSNNSVYKLFNHNNNLYMTGTDGSDGNIYIYKSNYGNRGYFFSTYYPSTITLIINPKGTVVNIYDVLEMLTEVYDSSGTELTDTTFSTIQIWNEYQDSGIITLSTSNARRRFRSWKFNKIREAVSSNIKQPKIRSPHIFVKLSFTNTANRKILLDNLITYYIPSKMMY